MDELDAYRAAWIVLAKPDPDAFVRERETALVDDPAGMAAWRRIDAAMKALRAGPGDDAALH